MDNHQWQRRVDAPECRVWNPRYRMLDCWRGLACLIVVVHHAGLALKWAETEGSDIDSWERWLVVLALRKMNLGVSLFFVISGYCIAASAGSTARKGESPWEFLRRRFWRIYPPYWAALLGFVAVAVALQATGLTRFSTGRALGIELDAPGSLDWRHWLGNLTLTETWRAHFWGPANVYTSVAWSLCFEEQFYLICFLTLLLAPKRFFKALAGVTLAIVAVRVWLWRTDGLGMLRGTFPLLWHEFAVGLAVYYRLNVAQRLLEKRLIEASVAALLLVGVFHGDEGTVMAAAFGLVLVLLRPWDETWSNLACLAPLRASGQRCYSIYLAHLPVVVIGNRWLFELGATGFWARALIMVPIVSAAGVAAGWAFHSLVETRFLNQGPTPFRLGPPARSHPRRWRINASPRPSAPPVGT